MALAVTPSRDHLEAMLNTYLALQADALDEGDNESAEALSDAIEATCARLDAMA